MSSKMRLVITHNGLELIGDNGDLMDFAVEYGQRMHNSLNVHAEDKQDAKDAAESDPKNTTPATPADLSKARLHVGAHKMLSRMSPKELYAHLVSLMIQSGDKGVGVSDFFGLVGKSGRGGAVAMTNYLKSKGVRYSLLLAGKRVGKPHGKPVRWYATPKSGELYNRIMAIK